MSRAFKIKAVVLAAFAVASVVLMGVILSSMQDKLSVDDCTSDIRYEMENLPGLLAAAGEETAQNTETFDAVYQSKAASVAFMANNNVGFAATDAKMAEYRDLLGVGNVMVVDRDGAVVARAQDTRADFSYERYNQLRTVFDTGEPSEAVEVEFDDGATRLRYYAARIDDSLMAVIEQDPAELYQLVEETGSLSSVLGNVSVGQGGYVFAVSSRDYLVAYHPDEALVGADALDLGIDVADLEDGAFSWMTVNGESLYCGVSKIDDTYYLSAVPESELASSRNLTVGVILFVFFSVLAVVIL